MAAISAGKAKQEVKQSAVEESDENEVEKSLDDFLRDTNELVNTTQDNVKSPASSEDTDSECFNA